MFYTGWLTLIGLTGLAVALVSIGLLSRRMGEATRASPHYIGFFVAALLVLLSILARLANLLFGLAPPVVVAQTAGWILLYNGLPALGLTLGVIFAWRYWSWLLAERD